ncbi:MAG: MFS transporter [Alphaproteobacteria bacterium]|nr:MFS transporter [Alphaproteobacteria bacterium]
MSFVIQNARFLSFGVLLAFLSSFGQTYFFGIFRQPISDDLGLNNSEFGLFYMLVTLGSAFGLTVFGTWIDRMPLRGYTVLLILLLSAGCLLMGFSGPLVTVFLAMVIVRLVGQGLMVHAAMTSMSRYFEKGRGKAVAIAGLGMPIGQALLPPLAVFLLLQMDWRTSWFVFAVTTVCLGVPLGWFLLRGHDRRHEHWLACQDMEAGQPDTAGPSRRRDVVKDYRFYLLLPAILVVPFWITAVFFFVADIAASVGWTMQDFTGMYWIYMLGAAAVPLLGGAMVDRFGGKRLVPFYPPLMGCGLLFILAGSGFPAVAGFLIFLGLVLGFAGPVNNAMWAELYGTKHLGEVKSLATSILLVSTALAPYLLGLLLDTGVSLSAILMAGVTHSFLAALLALPVALRA